MRVFLSVVSHKHASMIQELQCLPDLAKKFIVVLKNNVAEESSLLSKYCNDNSIYLVDEQYGCGFGANNNFIFKYCVERFNIKAGDIFITLNPDVFITCDEISELANTMQSESIYFSAITLYKDSNHICRDYSIRKFPNLKTFVCSFLGLGNNTMIKQCESVSRVDWAAGSFLAFDASLYQKLQGFDERYFMYCEDIDICYRAKQLGHQLTYLPQYSALHLAKHANRKVFSKHFLWHIYSALIFLINSKLKLSPKSIL
ncbi:glycosyltransferase family 2 protein [Kosakonia sacchari]|uniref:Glycosyltransferase n=1 Tax=Kosakonia sacchari TaxID=1158459 RepID=A0ABZ0MU23_9ENTR|nr:glycosyltransferase [Kosakonia sacchari]WOZ79003.1 glycosyltransferase [Kosakonia sacchari]